MAASNRWLAMVGGAIVIAVLVGVAVTVLVGGERQYAAGTPERAVQDYLRAVNDQDATLAMASLSPEAAKACDDTARRSISDRASTLRASLERATVRGDTAEVRVRITESYGGDSPFGSGESSSQYTFSLKQLEGTWRLTFSPWPLYCTLPGPPSR